MVLRKGIRQVLSTLISGALVFTSISFPAQAHAAVAPGVLGQIKLSSKVGIVTDSWTPDSVSEYRSNGVLESQHADTPTRRNAGTVILIQDLHLHYPTQKRILRILNHLYDRNIVSGPVGVEGVQGDYDTSFIASYPASKRKSKLVDYFLKNGEMSGDEAFAVLRGEGHRLFGIDESNYYQLNRELYKGTLQPRHSLLRNLILVEQKVSALKKEHYSAGLKRLDHQVVYDVRSTEALKARKLELAQSSLLTNLIEIDFSLGYLTKLLRQQTTLDEVQYVAQRLPQFVAMTGKLLELNRTNLSAAVIEETLKASIDFYAVAVMRDEPLARNTLSLLRSSESEYRRNGVSASQPDVTPTRRHAGTAIAMVTGGFHTAGITRALKKAGVGYVVITPFVNDVSEDYHKLYQSRMKGDHTSLNAVADDLHLSLKNLRAAEVSVVIRMAKSFVNPIAQQYLGARDRGFSATLDLASDNIDSLWLRLSRKVRLDRLMSVVRRHPVRSAFAIGIVATGAALIVNHYLPLLLAAPVITAILSLPIEGDAEDFRSLEKHQIPEEYLRTLSQHGLLVKNVSVHRLKAGSDPKSLQQFMREDHVPFILGMTVAQALGAIGFAGKGAKVGKVADGAAMTLGEQELKAYVKNHPREAVVIAGDEGLRDGSFSLEQGTIYFGEYTDLKLTFKTNDVMDLDKLNQEISRLESLGVKIRYFAGDALEATKELEKAEAAEEVGTPTNSWAVSSLSDERNEFANDEQRIGGWSYAAPKDAQIDPFELPSSALPKIAEANGFTKGTPEFDNFINHLRFTILGPRGSRKGNESEQHRHHAFLADARAMQAKYSGLIVVAPGDGDAVPRVVAGLGLELDGYRTVVGGRSGAVEATLSLIPIANNPGEGHFKHTYVSESATTEDFRADLAYDYGPQEDQSFEHLGISKEAYTHARDAARRSGKGLLAMTAVTGASESMFGATFARLLQRVRFRSSASVEKNGEVVTHTLLVTRDGSTLVVRTTLETADLAKSRDQLLQSSAPGRAYVKETRAAERNEILTRAEQAKRTPIVGGNWKMAIKTPEEAEKLLRGVAAEAEGIVGVEIFVAPSATHLPIVSAALRDLIKEGQIPENLIHLGAQDVSAEDTGAWTGQNSWEQYKAFGVTHIVLGHSEQRRGNLKKSVALRDTMTSSLVNDRVKTALTHGFTAVVAVGETDEEYTDGYTEEVISEQVRVSLAGVSRDAMSNVVIAYEPIWAIGTGKTASPDQADKIQRFIRGLILDMYGEEVAAAIRIQYGGSMKPNNVAALMAKPNVDGGLIGGAALIPSDFGGILDGAAASVTPKDAEGVMVKMVPTRDRSVKIAFGTSGWRGLLVPAGTKFLNGNLLPKGSEGFTMQNVNRVAQGIADVLAEDPEYQSGMSAGVAYDARPGGREFAIRIVEVLRANGIRVNFSDQILPTPVSAEMTRANLPASERLAVAFHVTASHNPYLFTLEWLVDLFKRLFKGAKWMGLKVMKNGRPANDDYTGKIAARANDESKNETYRYRELAPAELDALKYDAIQASNERLAKAFKFKDADGLIAKLNALQESGKMKKTLWNVLHGGTSLQAQQLVKMMIDLGLKVPSEVLNTRAMSEGNIEKFEDGHPIVVVNDKGVEELWGPEPRPIMYKAKMEKYMEEGVAAGVFDGDGDRTEIFDLDGKTTLSPNILGVAFGHFLMKTGRTSGKQFRRTLPTTRNLDLLAKFFNVPLKQTPVGSKHFVDDDSVVDVEESGHIFFQLGEEVFADSALGEFLLGLLIMAETGKSLKQYYEDDVVPDLKTVGNPLVYNRTAVQSKYVTEEFKQGLQDLRVNRPQAFADALAQKMGKTVRIVDSTTDKSGILVEFEDGSWAMYRLSGTDGSVRIYGEDLDVEKLTLQEKIVEDVLVELTSAGPDAAQKKLSESPSNAAWAALEDHFNQVWRDPAHRPHLRDLFAQEPKRAERMSLDVLGVHLDYSKNLITDETLRLLLQLANAVGLRGKIEAMFKGEKINNTEGRAVLHTALRAPKDATILVDGVNVVPQVHAVLDHMTEFSNQVRSGEWKGHSGKRIRNVVNIGIGGSDLGPVMAYEASKHYSDRNLTFRFVSNVDGTDLAEAIRDLDLEETLFIIASKTYTTQETLENAKTARQRVLDVFSGNAEAIAKHFVALSTNVQLVKEFGIDPANMFEFWDWVGGRYSMDSAIGLSTMLSIGPENFKEMLAGMHEMDGHYRTAPFEKNLPVLLALLDIWYINLFDAETRAILPYDQYSKRLAAYFQQQDMESDGKSVTKDGKPVTRKTGAIVFGEPGTNGQHSFYQLMHQGTRLVPADFYAFVNSLNPIGKHHALLLSNVLGQPAALAFGKTLEEVLADGKTSAELAPHKVFEGNRPSNLILVEQMSPRALGKILAVNEHRVATRTFIWDINAFDQWGVELGKALAGQIVPVLLGEKTGNFDPSTTRLIELIKRLRRNSTGMNSVGFLALALVPGLLTLAIGIGVAGLIVAGVKAYMAYQVKKRADRVETREFGTKISGRGIISAVTQRATLGVRSTASRSIRKLAKWSNQDEENFSAAQAAIFTSQA